MEEIPTGFFSKFITPTKSRNTQSSNLTDKSSRNISLMLTTPKQDKQRKLMPAYLLQRSMMNIEEQASLRTRKKYIHRQILDNRDEYTTAHFGEEYDQGDRNNTTEEAKEIADTLDPVYLLYFLLSPRILKVSINKSPPFEFICKLVPSEILSKKFIEHYSFQWCELESLQVVNYLYSWAASIYATSRKQQ